MNRRRFLVGTATGAAAIAGLGITAGAQAPAPAVGPGRQGTAAGRAGGGRGGGPANVPAEKLARISLMTLNFNSAGILKFPWTANPGPTQTVDILDLPQYYVDRYGVHNMEFQHDHLVQLVQGNSKTPPDPAFFKEMRARLDAANVTATQVNIEIGVITNLDAAGRQAWIEAGKKWVDAAPILGVTRLMLNQTGLTDENKAGVISLWKEIQDYAKPKGIKISAETRGNGAPPAPGGARGGQAGAAAPAPAAPAPVQTNAQRLRLVWGVLEETIEAAGGYSNLDWGGGGRFLTQQELHDAIKGLLKTNSGNMHVKSSPDWDIGLAVKYSESIGYKGLYSIEVNPEAAIRIVYNAILANL